MWLHSQARKGKTPLFMSLNISEEISHTIAYFAKGLW